VFSKGIRSLETVPRQVFIFHLVDTDSAQRGSYAAAEREKAAEYINE
jgi:hypothetical protein